VLTASGGNAAVPTTANRILFSDMLAILSTSIRQGAGNTGQLALPRGTGGQIRTQRGHSHGLEVARQRAELFQGRKKNLVSEGPGRKVDRGTDA
jgi:hypothetical protein